VLALGDYVHLARAEASERRSQAARGVNDSRILADERPELVMLIQA
jgi:hypothetical protein